ncbi:DNA-directed RNA polymerase subunit RPC12/RpoP [Streptacidiphilus sp. MAP12-20]|uniref:hypothetical protein n=1 Tax=Streptacidiphilus sp. MAP12-20 TaxID=3156299 RepID=UPI003512728D
MTNEIRCTQCGAIGLQPGFIEDPRGSGDTRWVAGAIERGPLGGAKRMGRKRMQIDAFRCPDCGHLELFATQEPR